MEGLSASVCAMLTVWHTLHEFVRSLPEDVLLNLGRTCVLFREEVLAFPQFGPGRTLSLSSPLTAEQYRLLWFISQVDRLFLPFVHPERQARFLEYLLALPVRTSLSSVL